MRGLALVVLLASALAGCAAHTPEPAEKPTSYNRRELPPDAPGLFTGRDGTWTVYRNDGERAAAPAPEAAAPEPAPPKKREILMCGHGETTCEQPEK